MRHEIWTFRNQNYVCKSIISSVSSISLTKYIWISLISESARKRRKAELTLAQIREKLPNGWADWHEIWHTCTNSYGNGYTPNKLPLETQGGNLGGFTGSTIKKSGEAARLAPTWFTFADSSGNGHRLNTSRPSIPQVAFRGGGGVRVSQIKKKSGEAIKQPLNGWTDWPQIWHTSADPSGNGWIYIKQIDPRDTRGWGVLGVKHSKVWGSCQTAGPIGTNFGSRLRIHLGMDTG